MTHDLGDQDCTESQECSLACFRMKNKVHGTPFHLKMPFKHAGGDSVVGGGTYSFRCTC